MRTLKIGIAGYDGMKARTMAIARRRAQVGSGRAGGVVHLDRELCEGAFAAKPGASGDDWARETGLGHRARGVVRAQQVEPVAGTQDDVALRFGGAEERGARRAGAADYVRSSSVGCVVTR